MSRTAKPLPSTFILKSVVNERVNNFINNKHPLLSTAIGKDDSKSAWYSIEQFDELVREMYYQHADGVRIYFGAYDNTDPDYPDQLTIIFVPTYFDTGTNRHTDIIIDDTSDFEERIEAVEESINRSDIKKSLDSVGLCPPSCFDQDPAFPLIEVNR